ncbi:MAG: hypothetical protein ACLSA6_14760 [Holdemania massiliensis]
MNRNEVLNAAVEEQAQLICKTAEVIWKYPETGFKEWKTSAYLEQIFTDLGYELVKPGIPGFYADLKPAGRDRSCASWASWIL